MADPKDAGEFSDFISEAEYLLETVQDSGTPVRGGGISDTDGLSRNYNRTLVTKNVVLPSNIMNMPKFSFILRSYPYSFVKSGVRPPPVNGFAHGFTHAALVLDYLINKTGLAIHFSGPSFQDLINRSILAAVSAAIFLFYPEFPVDNAQDDAKHPRQLPLFRASRLQGRLG